MVVRKEEKRLLHLVVVASAVQLAYAQQREAALPKPSVRSLRTIRSAQLRAEVLTTEQLRAWRNSLGGRLYARRPRLTNVFVCIARSL